MRATVSSVGLTLRTDGVRVSFLAMTSLLELPAFREQVHRISTEDYHRLAELGMLSEDVELLRGIVVRKMAKSPLHEFVSEQLLDRLRAQVPRGYVVRQERPLTLRDSEPEPDISVVRGKREDWLRAHPSTAELVIEISISSLAIDEGKAEIYAEAGIPEYWLVRPEDRALDVYREPSREGYLRKTTVSEKEVLRCASIAGIAIVVEELLKAS